MSGCREVKNEQREWQLSIIKEIVNEIDQVIGIKHKDESPIDFDSDKEFTQFYDDSTYDDCLMDEGYSFMGKGTSRTRANGQAVYSILKNDYTLNMMKIKRYLSQIGIELIYIEKDDAYEFDVARSNSKRDAKNSEIVSFRIYHDNDELIVSMGVAGGRV